MGTQFPSEIVTGEARVHKVYQAVEMVAAAEAGAAVPEDVPLHSWALIVLYPTKTWGSSIQGKAGMV
jgi:hypothetical protein